MVGVGAVCSIRLTSFAKLCVLLCDSLRFLLTIFTANDAKQDATDAKEKNTSVSDGAAVSRYHSLQVKIIPARRSGLPARRFKIEEAYCFPKFLSSFRQSEVGV